jgi:hypothetical protein
LRLSPERDRPLFESGGPLATLFPRISPGYLQEADTEHYSFEGVPLGTGENVALRGQGDGFSADADRTGWYLFF